MHPRLQDKASLVRHDALFAYQRTACAAFAHTVGAHAVTTPVARLPTLIAYPHAARPTLVVRTWQWIGVPAIPVFAFQPDMAFRHVTHIQRNLPET